MLAVETGKSNKRKNNFLFPILSGGESMFVFCFVFECMRVQLNNVMVNIRSQKPAAFVNSLSQTKFDLSLISEKVKMHGCGLLQFLQRVKNIVTSLLQFSERVKNTVKSLLQFSERVKNTVLGLSKLPKGSKIRFWGCRNFRKGQKCSFGAVETSERVKNAVLGLSKFLQRIGNAVLALFIFWDIISLLYLIEK
jgi:hypothetical protein